MVDDGLPLGDPEPFVDPIERCAQMESARQQHRHIGIGEDVRTALIALKGCEPSIRDYVGCMPAGK